MESNDDNASKAISLPRNRRDAVPTRPSVYLYKDALKCVLAMVSFPDVALLAVVSRDWKNVVARCPPMRAFRATIALDSNSYYQVRNEAHKVWGAAQVNQRWRNSADEQELFCLIQQSECASVSGPLLESLSSIRVLRFTDDGNNEAVIEITLPTSGDLVPTLGSSVILHLNYFREWCFSISWYPSEAQFRNNEELVSLFEIMCGRKCHAACQNHCSAKELVRWLQARSAILRGTVKQQISIVECFIEALMARCEMRMANAISIHKRAFNAIVHAFTAEGNNSAPIAAVNENKASNN